MSPERVSFKQEGKGQPMQSQFLNRRALIPCRGAEDGKSAGTSSGKSGTGNSVAMTVSIRSSAESTGRCVKYNTVGRIILHLLDIMQRDSPPPPPPPTPNISQPRPPPSLFECIIFDAPKIRLPFKLAKWKE